MVPGCEYEGPLHNGHIVEHCKGGTRTLGNQGRICPLHNYMMLMDLLHIVGDGDDPEFVEIPGKKRVPWIYDRRDYPKFRAWLEKNALLVRDEDQLRPWKEFGDEWPESLGTGPPFLAPGFGDSGFGDSGFGDSGFGDSGLVASDLDDPERDGSGPWGPGVSRLWS